MIDAENLKRSANLSRVSCESETFHAEICNFMKTILYIDSCVARDRSRTERLAQAYLQKRLVTGDARLETVALEDLFL